MRVLDYAASRQRPFKTTDAAAVFALSQRQTLRWLRAAESLGLVAWTGKFPTDRKAEWLPLVKIVPIPLMLVAHPSEEIPRAADEPAAEEVTSCESFSPS